MITLLDKLGDNHILNKNDIYDIVLMYIKNNHLERYLIDTIFTNDNDVVAHYNITTSKIVLNHDRIKESCKNLYDGIKKLYQISDKYDSYFINYYYLYVIYHELTHVSQRAKYENKANCLYEYLYELFIILINNDKVLYKKSHNIFPMEIEANNKGLLSAYQLMNHTELPSNEINIMYVQYLFSLSSSYEKKNNHKIIAPIELLRKQNNIVDLNLIKVLLNEIKLNRIERMNLGLPITINEYDNIEEEKYKCIIKAI